jgi:hypothetical protein
MNAPRLLAASLTDRSSVRAAIGRAAERTGVDFTYLLNQAKTESGLDPDARARTSSASGLYQFIDQSWLGVVKQHGAKHGMAWAADAIRQRGGRYTVDPAMRQAVFDLRDQAEPAALMAGEFANDNAEGLSRALGRQPSATDLYFAHFLGLDGAARFLRAAGTDPDASAASAFPREARANRSIFYTRSGEARSMSEVYALMARKIGGSDAGPVKMARKPEADGAQLAYADDVFKEPGENQPDMTQMLATLGRGNRTDVLRPSPAQARLAYLMLSTTVV